MWSQKQLPNVEYYQKRLCRCVQNPTDCFVLWWLPSVRDSQWANYGHELPLNLYPNICHSFTAKKRNRMSNRTDLFFLLHSLPR